MYIQMKKSEIGVLGVVAGAKRATGEFPYRWYKDEFNFIGYTVSILRLATIITVLQTSADF